MSTSSVANNCSGRQPSLPSQATRPGRDGMELPYNYMANLATNDAVFPHNHPHPMQDVLQQSGNNLTGAEALQGYAALNNHSGQ